MNEDRNYEMEETSSKNSNVVGGKILASAIVAVVTLVALTVGATYAYFQVTTSGSVTNSTLTATTGPISSVAFSGGNKTITMNVTAAQMMVGTADKTFYAPASGSAATETATSIPVGVATQTNAGKNKCTFTVKVTPTVNDLWTAFSKMTGKAAGQIVLTVGGATFDFNSETFAVNTAVTKSGSITTTGAGAVNINAQLKLLNSKTINQNAIAGKTQTFTINITSFSCTTTG